MKRFAIALATVAMAVLAVASVATAHHARRDDHGRDVARCAHEFHFKLTHTNGLGDADHDGVSNAAECHHGTNPKRKDTHRGRPDGNGDDNHNGIPDDQDAAAKVTKVTPATATAPESIVITLPDGTTETGAVTMRTELRCETAAPPAPMPTTTTTVTAPPPMPATTRDHGGSGGDDHGDGGNDNSGPGSNNSGPGNNNDNNDNDNNDDNDNEQCAPGALTVGAVVHEAELRVSPSGAVFEEIELIVPASA